MADWLRDSLFGTFLLLTLAVALIGDRPGVILVVVLVGLPLIVIVMRVIAWIREKQENEKRQLQHRLWLLGSVLKRGGGEEIRPMDENSLWGRKK